MTRYTTASSQQLEHAERARLVTDVQYYLTQTPRQLPSRYLYDEVGSALFEVICRLPWYAVTRAESRLLSFHAADVFDAMNRLSNIVELGSGSGEKLRILLEDRLSPTPIDVHLVDVSASALETSARTLSSLRGVRISSHRAAYESGLAEALQRTAPDARTLVLFLGSNIGNFDPPGAAALLDNIRRGLRPNDGLLLGADLVKPEERLLLAYNDPLGVTAAFNKNLLVRLNRDLGANFDVSQFDHVAVWNPAESRVEGHLAARSAQDIDIDAAKLQFRIEKDERIWTESSYKYRAAELGGMLAAAGFRAVRQWVDWQDCFALTLSTAV